MTSYLPSQRAVDKHVTYFNQILGESFWIRVFLIFMFNSQIISQAYSLNNVTTKKSRICHFIKHNFRNMSAVTTTINLNKKSEALFAEIVVSTYHIIYFINPLMCTFRSIWFICCKISITLTKPSTIGL